MKKSKNNPSHKQICAQGAGRVLGGHGCLLIQPVLCYAQDMDQHKGDTKVPARRQKTRLKGHREGQMVMRLVSHVWIPA